MELSGLDLPDVTVGPAASTAKGLSRKRPRRSFNTTAFEKRLKDGDGKIETSIEEVHRLKMRLWVFFCFFLFFVLLQQCEHLLCMLDVCASRS